MPPFEHSVEADVSLTFAWNYWTDVRNWADPPASFTLEEPFLAGSKGVTVVPSQDPIHWTVAAVDPEKFARITIQLDRAVFSFEWQFEALSDNRTRLTQRIAVTGENAEAYAGAQAAFRENLPGGMNRITAAMAQADAEAAGSASPR